ncbi:hypothetical protein EMA8858_02327 [Emticicia aquatica]|uniref:Uncharacterized protein n=1 Tax=Emticicia aquatica TaxID=1681835 RepID=A0ABN8ET66_9BACT|nr:hypothetical protein [Emticicia aquatica]CAH0996197.1 hypothetical protein EMA8858_02327 [Emticicia aquatica]
MEYPLLREPYFDKKTLTKYELKPFETWPALFSFCRDRHINFPLSKKYLICIEKSLHTPIGYRPPSRDIGFKNDSGGYTFCIRDKYRELPKGFMLSIISQSITTFIRTEDNTLTIFYDFWDFLSFLSLFPEKENGNFIVLNRYTKHDHNLPEAKLIAGRFATVENYIKWEDVAKTEYIQSQLEEVCDHVIPRWKDFDEPNFNEY